MSFLERLRVSEQQVLQWTNNLHRVLHNDVTFDQLIQRQALETTARLVNEMLWIGDWVRFVATDRPCLTNHAPFNAYLENNVPAGEYKVRLRLICADLSKEKSMFEILQAPVQSLKKLFPAVDRQRHRVWEVVRRDISELNSADMQLRLLAQSSANSRWQLVVFLQDENEYRQYHDDNANVDHEVTADFSLLAQKYSAMYSSSCVRIRVVYLDLANAMEKWGVEIQQHMQSLPFEFFTVVTFEFVNGNAWIAAENNLHAQFRASHFGKRALQAPAPIVVNNGQIPHQIRMRALGVPPMQNSPPEAAQSQNAQRTMHNDMRTPGLNQMSLQRADHILNRLGLEDDASRAMRTVLGDSNMRGLILQPFFYGNDRASMYQRLSQQEWNTWNGIMTYTATSTSAQHQRYNATGVTRWDFDTEMRQLWSNFWRTMLRCVKQDFPVLGNCMKLYAFDGVKANELMALVRDPSDLRSLMFDEEVLLRIPISRSVLINTDEQVNFANFTQESVLVNMVQERQDHDILIVDIELTRETTQADIEQLQAIMQREFPSLIRQDKIDVTLFFAQRRHINTMSFALVQSRFFKRIAEFKHERELRWIHAHIDPAQFNWQFEPLPPLDAPAQAPQQQDQEDLSD
jgi:hypothetical protein